jgi:hypothetical protein
VHPTSTVTPGSPSTAIPEYTSENTSSLTVTLTSDRPSTSTATTERTTTPVCPSTSASTSPSTSASTLPNTHRHKRRNRRFVRRFPQTPDCKQVINLSTLELTDEQTHVLSFGPKFCPTPTHMNKLQLLEDVCEGLRKIRLKEFFLQDNTPTQLPTRPKFYKKTYWCPPTGRDEALDAYCSTIQINVRAFQPVPNKKKNIDKNSHKAIQELKRMVDERKIRIVPADKGGAVVVQDFEDYKTEALRQLNDPVTYERLSADPSKDIAERSNELLEELKSKACVDNNTYNWAHLDTNCIKCHTFYHLPKVHKRRDNPPGRPIVSGIGGPTEKLSKLVDHWLQPVVHQLPSFVQDTTHFLRIVEEWNEHYGPLPQETLIVTIDVVGLYTNIPHDEVGPSIGAALDKYGTAMEIPPLHLLVSIIEHVLQNNVFQFDDVIYKQKFGTAMGTPMAPTIANLFMAGVEDRLQTNSPWSIDSNCWKRFIDDIVMLWFHGENQLKLFLEWINTIHPTIKFTANYGTTNIPYLDVGLSINDNKLTTDLHVKDTDANMCLPFHSCHPRHCTRSIPYSQCLRIRRICSSDDTFRQRATELKEKLLKRGYPGKLLDTAIQKVTALPRHETLQYKDQHHTERVPVVITHNPANPPLSHWLKANLTTLHCSARMRKAVPHPPIVGERNCKNLRNILMPSRLPSSKLHTHQQELERTQPQSSGQQQFSGPQSQQQERPCAEGQNQQQQNGCSTCSAKRCVICKHHLKSTKTFRSAVNSGTHTIKSQVSCTSHNLIYLIDCVKCGKVQYVGETGQTLKKKRFYGHRHNILHYKDNTEQSTKYKNEDTMVAKHFNENGHTIDDMKVTIIEQINVLSADVRKRREKFWRHQLQTNFPDGLNVFD